MQTYGIPFPLAFPGSIPPPPPKKRYFPLFPYTKICTLKFLNRGIKKGGKWKEKGTKRKIEVKKEKICVNRQWWASCYFTSVNGKRNQLLLFRYLFFLVTVLLQLLVTDILNVTEALLIIT
jgi:hypothetical protein